MKNLFVKLDYTHLKNETHAEFYDTVNTLFGKYTPASLGVQPQYDAYKPLYDAETSALDVVLKSAKTAQIDAQDASRDSIYRGFAEAVKSALHHFDVSKREAAKRIAVILEHYGNIAAKTFDAETAAIDDLLRELGGAGSAEWSADVVTLALSDWLVQLSAENHQFKELMSERYEEQSQRPAVRMKDARAAVDAAFTALLAQIEALSLVNGITQYEHFIREMNVILERYRSILARQAGQRAARREHNQ